MAFKGVAWLLRVWRRWQHFWGQSLESDDYWQCIVSLTVNQLKEPTFISFCASLLLLLPLRYYIWAEGRKLCWVLAKALAAPPQILHLGRRPQTMLGFGQGHTTIWTFKKTRCPSRFICALPYSRNNRQNHYESWWWCTSIIFTFFPLLLSHGKPNKKLPITVAIGSSNSEKYSTRKT